MSAIFNSIQPVAKQGFNFNPDTPIKPNQPTKLVIKVFGGPIGLLQALVADVNDVPRNGIGFDGMGASLSTGHTGMAEWEFLTDQCAGGYLKWRVTLQASAANLGAFHVEEEVWQSGAMVQSTRVDGVLPAGQMLSSFINGVLISNF